MYLYLIGNTSPGFKKQFRKQSRKILPTYVLNLRTNTVILFNIVRIYIDFQFCDC